MTLVSGSSQSPNRILKEKTGNGQYNYSSIIIIDFYPHFDETFDSMEVSIKNVDTLPPQLKTVISLAC